MLELLRHLNIRDVHTRLCVIDGPQGVDDSWTSLESPIYLNVPLSQRSRYFQRHRVLRKAIRQWQPDLVHSHLWPTAAAVNAALWGSGIPHLIHIRDTPPAFQERRWQSQVKRRMLAWSLNLRKAWYVAVSHASADYAIQHLAIPKERTRVVLNGVDLAGFLHGKRRTASLRAPIVIGCAGRLVETKGHIYVLRAIASLRREQFDVRLRIAGSGSMRPSLEKESRELGIADFVQIVDYHAEIQDFYRSLDIYVLPSLSSEGLSRSLIEAMASGIPVIATNCEGTSEALRDGEDGIIVRCGESDAIATAIKQLIRDPQLRARLSASARQHAIDALSINRVVSEIEKLYRWISRQTPLSP